MFYIDLGIDSIVFYFNGYAIELTDFPPKGFTMRAQVAELIEYSYYLLSSMINILKCFQIHNRFMVFGLRCLHQVQTTRSINKSHITKICNDLNEILLRSQAGWRSTNKCFHIRSLTKSRTGDISL